MLNTLRNYIVAYVNKISNKLRGVVRVRHEGQQKGVVLLSYLTRPFTLAPNEQCTDPHSNYWVPVELARLFSSRGYDVDIIDWDNDTFIPSKQYVACIDIQHNLERLAPYLGKDCKKVMHVTAAQPDFQNAAEQRRLADLKARRNISLPMSRREPSSNNMAFANYVTSYGNSFVRGTYSQFSKEIVPIPVPAMGVYDFPEAKDFATARKHFLWFGGGGAILKGLDLVVEAFAQMPELKLTIVGPAAFEKDFAEAYARELALPNIKQYPRPHFTRDGGIVTGDKKLLDILNECAAVVFPSASEGAGGSVVHAMQAGLIPIVTRESGIDDDAPQLTIANPTVENIIAVVRHFSSDDPKTIGASSRQVWEFAHTHHTKKAFSRAYANFIDSVLKL